MPFASKKLPDTYWTDLQIQNEDLEFLYNHLLEIELPQTSAELSAVLIRERIIKEIENLTTKQNQHGGIYLPGGSYSVGDKILFPQLAGSEGKITSIRPANNPDMPSFNVLGVDFGNGIIRNFAADLEDHILNKPVEEPGADKNLDSDYVISQFGESIADCLTQKFSSLPDLVQIAGSWFPHSLLVDVNIGFLNLAEAVLEMADGGPLTTKSIIEQIELPTDANSKLTEFSMNLALQIDERFDEVGPSGKTMWFLKRLEPEEVQTTPLYLRFQTPNLDLSGISQEVKELNCLVYDELEPEGDLPNKADEIEVSLIFPHWRSGTLPLSRSIARLFPTAYESPRVKFTFVDQETGKTYPGWVVRPDRYVHGLADWYKEKNLIPGSLFRIKKGKIPGEVLIQSRGKRVTKEWIRSVLIGVDGGTVFTMLKQQLSNEIDERMAIAVPDTTLLDSVWEQTNRQKGTLENNVMSVMRELIKLNPQGHVHAQELYAAVNIIRRCPPSYIIAVLANQPNVEHMGNLYFRLTDLDIEE